MTYSDPIHPFMSDTELEELLEELKLQEWEDRANRRPLVKRNRAGDLYV